ncbi:MAG: SUMF1/EgtB/PvdO family nonheme iron enzyme [Planctomycetota bacterium]|jgi:formylglycine-generating enzyme required for sulfatase activity
MVTDDPSSREHADPLDHPPPSEGPDHSAATRTHPDRIGAYQIEQALAEGESRTSYLARDTRQENLTVVLEVLPSITSGAARARLRALAAKVGRLRHPHLVRLLGFEEDPSRPERVCFVTEHVPGTTLARLIAETEGGLPTERVIDWAGQLAGALDHVHEHGVAHGAVDPSNVIVDENGRAHLGAAGIGQAFRRLRLEPTEREVLFDDDEAPPSPPVPDDGVSSDLYALATTLYAALGGDSPAGGEPAPPASPIPGRSVQVNLALVAALSPDAGDRPARARDLAQALQGAPVKPRRPKVAPPAQRRRPPLRLVAGALALVAAVVGGWLWLGPHAAPSDRGPGPTDDAPAVQVPPVVASERRERPARASDLLAIDREIKAAAAGRARSRWEAIAAREPATLYDRLRPQAEHLEATAQSAGLDFAGGRFEGARRAWEQATQAYKRLLEEHDLAGRAAHACSEIWQEAMAAAPSRWLDDEAVNEACSEAHLLADAAGEATQAGRFDAAREGFLVAAHTLTLATALHTEGVAALIAGAERARREGRFEEALALLDRVAPLADPEAVKAERIATYLALARARNSKSSRDEARRAVDALLTLDPQHPEGSGLQAAIAAHWMPRHGQTLVNSLSQTLNFVEPGEFLMGSPPGEPGRDRSERRHTVRITRGFWIGRTEVTRGQFGAFVDDTGYVSDAETEGWSHGLGSDGRWRQIEGLSWRDPGFAQMDNHPVVCVSYHDAVAFCRWLGHAESRTYRLPTEAEWEYACRAGSLGAFHWGEEGGEERAWGNTADQAWAGRYSELSGFPWFDGYVFTSPVAGFPANGWGLFDMHGNVQEWCLDRYGPYDPGEVAGPTGPRSTSAVDRLPRVLRGGSFAAPAARCRSAHRDASPPSSRFVTLGFRVVLEGEGTEGLRD